MVDSGLYEFLDYRLCGFSIQPNWDDSKRFAVINADFHVLIYDFTNGEAVKGHKGHESIVSCTNLISFVICLTSNDLRATTRSTTIKLTRPLPSSSKIQFCLRLTQMSSNTICLRIRLKSSSISPIATRSLS